MEDKQGGKGSWLQRLKRLEARDKKLLALLALCLLAGLLLMNWGGGRGDPPKAAAETTPAPLNSSEAELEAKLSALLSQVKGAGQVQVLLLYSDSGQQLYAWEQERQAESDAASSTVRESSKLAVADQQPVLLKSSSPAIQGVAVIAEGAGEPLVRERLYQALKSLLNINADQIAIIEKERGI